jgi:hypothetical protein
MFDFRGTRRCPVVQGIKRSNVGSRVVAHAIGVADDFWKRVCVPWEVLWIKLIIKKHLVDPPLGSLNYRAIWRERPHGRRSTAAIMASSVAGVRTVRGGPALTSAAAVTFRMSWRRCCGRQNI